MTRHDPSWTTRIWALTWGNTVFGHVTGLAPKRTHNPLVAGSSPAGPTKRQVQVDGRFRGALGTAQDYRKWALVTIRSLSRPRCARETKDLACSRARPRCPVSEMNCVWLADDRNVSGCVCRRLNMGEHCAYNATRGRIRTTWVPLPPAFRDESLLLVGHFSVVSTPWTRQIRMRE
jgi:hypothetical protein